MPNADQNYICPNQLGFLCRREFSEGGQVAGAHPRYLRYSQVEGARIAIQGDVIVTCGLQKSYSRRMDKVTIDGIRALHINPDGTAKRPVYEAARKRGGEPLPKPVRFEVSHHEVDRSNADILPPAATAMAVAGQTIVLACADRTLRLHDLKDGMPVARIDLPGDAVRDGIAVFGSRIYLTLTNGKIVSVTMR